VADGGGLENRYGAEASSWVRIPRPPLSAMSRTESLGVGSGGLALPPSVFAAAEGVEHSDWLTSSIVIVWQTEQSPLAKQRRHGSGTPLRVSIKPVPRHTQQRSSSRHAEHALDIMTAPALWTAGSGLPFQSRVRNMPLAIARPQRAVFCAEFGAALPACFRSSATARTSGPRFHCRWPAAWSGSHTCCCSRWSPASPSGG
jgi:hypothetical protein